MSSSFPIFFFFFCLLAFAVFQKHQLSVGCCERETSVERGVGESGNGKMCMQMLCSNSKIIFDTHSNCADREALIVVLRAGKSECLISAGSKRSENPSSFSIQSRASLSQLSICEKRKRGRVNVFFQLERKRRAQNEGEDDDGPSSGPTNEKRNTILRIRNAKKKRKEIQHSEIDADAR